MESFKGQPQAVNEKKILEYIYAQKYIFLITLFVEERVGAAEFERLFLKLRREDDYWMSGLWDKQIGKILDSFFLDVDEYTEEEIYDKDCQYNINEDKLKGCAKRTLEDLEKEKLFKELIEGASLTVNPK